MKNSHPCDICTQSKCGWDCFFHKTSYNSEYCNVYDCRYLHEDSCELGAYKYCGVWLKSNGKEFGDDD